MGSKDKFFSIISAEKGFDDIGLLQPTGGITGGVTNALKEGPLFSGKLLLTLTVTAPTAIKKGSAIRIGGMDSFHSGLTRVLKVQRPYRMVVDILYNGPSATTAPGNWNLDGGSGAWDAFMPVGADITNTATASTNIQMTFFEPNRQGGNEALVEYQEGKVYVFPGIIRTIQINTAGNIRLFRASTNRPGGKLTY